MESSNYKISQVMKSKSKSNSLGLIIIIGLFVVFTSLYSLYTPTLEESDGSTHWMYILRLAEGESNFVLEKSPPLYYFITSGLLSFYETDEPLVYDYKTQLSQIDDYHKFQHQTPNEFSLEKNKLQNECFSKFDCPEIPEQFPYSGTSQVVHLLRLFSIFCGVLTLIFVYKIAKKTIQEEKLSLIIVAFAAFIPMFTYINSVLSNETLAITLSTASIYYLFNYREKNEVKTIIIIGILVGLALLTKFTTLFLIPGMLISFFYFYKLKRISFKQFIYTSSLFLVIIFGISGWWYMLYGDYVFSSFQIFLSNLIGESGSQLEIETFKGYSENKFLNLINLERHHFVYFESVYGNIGWSAIKTHPFIMDSIKILISISLIGFTFFIMKKFSNSQILIQRNFVIILLIFSGLMLLHIILFQFVTNRGTGRNLLPAVSCFSIIIMLGIFYISEKIKIKYLVFLPIAIFLIANVYLLNEADARFEHGLPRDIIHDANHNLRIEISEGVGIDQEGIPKSRIRSTYLEDRTHDTILLLHPLKNGKNWYNFTMLIPDHTYDLEIGYGYLVNAKDRKDPVFFSVNINNQTIFDEMKNFNGKIMTKRIDLENYPENNIIKIATDSASYGNHAAWTFFQFRFVN